MKPNVKHKKFTQSKGISVDYSFKSLETDVDKVLIVC